MEKTSKAAIQERKIRVVFLPSDISSSTPHHSNVNGAVSCQYSKSLLDSNRRVQHEDAPPAYGSPAPSFGSPAPDAVTPLNHTVDNSAGIKSQNFSQRSDGKNTSDGKESTSSITSNIQSTLGVAASGVANAIPTSRDDLHAQLYEAKETVLKLGQQGEEQSLRQRAVEAVNQDSRERITTGTQQTADGVPVQIVAALCLLSFLLAYFFF